MTVALIGTPVLHTRRLILRAPSAADVSPFAAFMESDRARFVGGPVTEPGRAWRSWAAIIGHWAMRGFGMFTVVRADTGRAIGMAGPWFPDTWPEQEIGWSIWSVEDEGKGFASEAALATRDHAFTRLGWKTAVSYIDAGNAASLALARRLGAQLDDGAAVPPQTHSAGYDDSSVTQVWRYLPGGVTRAATQPATQTEDASA